MSNAAAPPPTPNARLVWGAVVAVFALFALTGPIKMATRSQPAASGTEPIVRMAGRAFSPATLTVAKGSVVRFDNDDLADHTVTGEDGTIDSGIIEPGESFEQIITQRFIYLCEIHPSMTAVVEIDG